MTMSVVGEQHLHQKCSQELRDRTDCYLDFTNEDYLKTKDFLGRITICDCSLNQWVLDSIFT